MMEKVEIFNAKQHPLWHWLRKYSELNGGDMEWNFEKYLIDRDGKLVGRWPSADEPNKIVNDIEKLLK